jgi:hypothetical protein
MFCAHCGAADQNEQAYCRRCGKWLGASAPDQRMKVVLVFSAVNAVLAASAAIALYATFLGTKTGPPAVYLAAAFCSVIAVHQTVSFFFNLGLTKRLSGGRSELESAREIAELSMSLGDRIRARRSELERARQATSESPEPRALADRSTTEFVDLPSVTESTTELLEPVPRVAPRVK